MARISIKGNWAATGDRRLFFDTTGREANSLYVGVEVTNDGHTQGIALVDKDKFLNALAEFLGARITVTEIERVETVKSEKVYG